MPAYTRQEISRCDILACKECALLYGWREQTKNRLSVRRYQPVAHCPEFWRDVTTLFCSECEPILPCVAHRCFSIIRVKDSRVSDEVLYAPRRLQSLIAHQLAESAMIGNALILTVEKASQRIVS